MDLLIHDGGLKEPLLHRFLVSRNELIEAKTNERYVLLQNNEYGLIATYAFSGIEDGQVKPRVGATTIIINKATQEFRWEEATTGYDALAG